MVPDIHHDRRAGPVGGFRHAGRKAPFSEKGRVAVPQHGMDGNRGRKGSFKIGFPEETVAVADLGQGGLIETENRKELFVPGQGREVKELGPGGVGVIGLPEAAMAPAGQAVEDIGVHGPKPQVPLLHESSSFRNILQDPGVLGRREVGGKGDAGLLPDGFTKAGGFEGRGYFRGPRALPDNRVHDGLPGPAVDCDRSFPLVAEAAAGHFRGHLVPGKTPGGRLFFKDVANDANYIRINLLGVVLDPADVVDDLPVGPRGARHKARAGTEQEGLRPLGGLVYGKIIFLQRASLTVFSMPEASRP